MPAAFVGDGSFDLAQCCHALPGLAVLRPGRVTGSVKRVADACVMLVAFLEAAAGAEAHRGRGGFASAGGADLTVTGQDGKGCRGTRAVDAWSR